MASKYTDPVSRFHDLLAVTPSLPAELRPQALRPIIDQGGNVEANLAQQIALHSRLDLPRAQALVHGSLPAQGDSAAKAAAVSQAASSAVTFSGEVDLSDPVMLWPGARLAFGIVFGLALAASTVFIFILARQKTDPSTAAYVSLAVSSALALIGVLILVMGYKNVTIKGSSPGSS